MSELDLELQLDLELDPRRRWVCCTPTSGELAPQRCWDCSPTFGLAKSLLASLFSLSNGEILMTLVTPLALNSHGFFVMKCTPLRAGVAGLVVTFNLIKPASLNDPDIDACHVANLKQFSTDAFTSFGFKPKNWAVTLYILRGSNACNRIEAFFFSLNLR